MRVALLSLLALTALPVAGEAQPIQFDGEYADKSFLNGQAVFELSVHQHGKALEIGFHAAYSDGHGATPDGTGTGEVNSGSAKFTWKDSLGNTGTGSMTLAGRDAVLSMQTAHVADARCLAFYRNNMRLKRVR